MTTLKEILPELRGKVEDAVQFMLGEFSEDWDRAERYFAGDCDVPSDEGRSDAVKTEIRDLIRALKPSIMRTLYHSRKPVLYNPSSVTYGPILDYQATYINQLFLTNGGYTTLQSAVDEALRLKAGPIKVFWVEDARPELLSFTGLTPEQIEQLKAAPDMVVEEVTEHEVHPDLGEYIGGPSGLYNAKVRKYHTNGKLEFEAFPIYEFFVSRNAQRLGQEGSVHGQRREITVGEAIELGLDANWDEMDTASPEATASGGSTVPKRGYATNEGEDTDSVDPLLKKVLITECYCWYDLKGMGSLQKYCFWFGGTQYEYIDHEEVDDFCIDLICADPQPFTVIGKSIPDIGYEMQDLQTLLLRMMVDNAAQSNNPRFAGDPTLVDFEDLMNNAIGAPIKTRGASTIQVVDVPFTGDRLIPFMQYLENMSQERIGVTKASQGLDPDAMQSTDKQAVMNTITLSQGQTELMVRNIVETGLIPLFQKALRIATRHMDKIQLIRVKGVDIPVDISMFDPDLAAIPNVGLGTTSPEQKLQALMFVLQEQKQAMQVLGMDNPFTSLSQIYNTYEDITELSGLVDAGRYFKIVTPTVEKAIMEAMAKQAQQKAAEAAENQPMDPSKTLLAVETMKNKAAVMKIMADQREAELTLELKATEAAEKLDLERDRMDQERMIELRKISQDALNSVIERKQAANDKPTGTKASSPTAAA